MLLRVLVIDSHAASRRELREHLESLDHVEVVGETRELPAGPVRGRAEINLAIVAVPEGAGEARAIEDIAQLHLHMPGASIMATGSADSADLVLRAIRAGAMDFLARPVSRADVAAACEKIRRLRRVPADAEGTDGRITAVYATKGGLGVTTLATNLAVCLAQQAPGAVLLIDLDLRQAGVSALLNLEPTYSVLDAFGQTKRLDGEFLRGLLVQHPCGLNVLPAPRELARAALTPEQIREGLAVIRAHFAHVVLDLPHDVDPGTLAALEASDEILYLVGSDGPAVRVAAAGLAALRRSGIDQGRLKVVGARTAAGHEGSYQQAEAALGVPLFWRTPNDYPTVIASINAGIPLALAAPRTAIARSLRQLSEALLGGPAARQKAKDPASSLWQRVWSLWAFRPGEV